jgi:inorganic triphosphatase YgiF
MPAQCCHAPNCLEIAAFPRVRRAWFSCLRQRGDSVSLWHCGIAVEAAIPTEVEIKLAARAGDLPRLKQALRAMAPQRRLSRAKLSSTYYDTPDLALRRRGLTLRVREEAGRFVQTVKAGDGLLARGEWEDAIAGKRPDLAAPASGGRLPPGVADGLRPLFVTGVVRNRVALEPSPLACIEVAIDEGEISAPESGRSERISEIELELKRGDAAQLCDLALRLNEAVPLSIETRSKAERGYRLAAAQTAPAPVHARPLALDRSMSAASALRHIARACLAQLLRNGPSVLVGQAEGVHQMRIAVRRLKAAVNAFRKIVPRAERRWIRDSLAELVEMLSEARNLDVLANELLRSARAALPAEAGLDAFAAAVERAQQEAHARLREEIRSPGHTATMLRLLRWCEGAGGPPEQSATLGELAPRRLDRRWRSLCRRSARFARLGARQRHRLRIAIKEFRYTIELFDGLFEPAAQEDFLKRLRQLQDGLGYANDVRAAGDLVARLAGAEPAAGAAARVLAWHEERLADARGRLRRRLRRLRRLPAFWHGPA